MKAARAQVLGDGGGYAAPHLGFQAGKEAKEVPNVSQQGSKQVLSSSPSHWPPYSTQCSSGVPTRCPAAPSNSGKGDDSTQIILGR